jgi:hypothetical protein
MVPMMIAGDNSPAAPHRVIADLGGWKVYDSGEPERHAAQGLGLMVSTAPPEAGPSNTRSEGEAIVTTASTIITAISMVPHPLLTSGGARRWLYAPEDAPEADVLAVARALYGEVSAA